ncbi:MAG: AIR synthase related protein [Desulfurococcales archaeon]|nr:AIR synthase related protein [Desulfurococcales archaeon]
MKKNPQNEYELYRELARITHSEYCLDYDACPLQDTNLVVNIDGYSEVYSRYSWINIDAWAYRAVMASLSDIITVGGQPIAVMVSLGVNNREEAFEASHGVKMASQDASVKVLKSDTNLARYERWIDIASIGITHRTPISRRAPRNAKKNALIVQLGYSGYGLLESMIANGKIQYEQIPGWLIYRRPPLNAWKVLSRCEVIAGMDNSDGLGYTLSTLGYLNGLDIYLEEIAIEPKVVKILDEEEINMDIRIVLGSWEDYNLVYLVEEDFVDCLERNCRMENIPFTIMGWAEEGSGKLIYKGRIVDNGKGWSWI